MSRGLLKSLRSLTLSRTGTASTENISLETSTTQKGTGENSPETGGDKCRKSLSLNNAGGSSRDMPEQRKVSRNSIHIMQKQKQSPAEAKASPSPSSGKPNRLSRMLTRRRADRYSRKQSGDFVMVNDSSSSSNPYSDSPGIAHRQQPTPLLPIAADDQRSISPFSSSPS
ncbi:hypothetical protein LPJ56_004757, partial [Coemansia sp. RSA 2599]